MKNKTRTLLANNGWRKPFFGGPRKSVLCYYAFESNNKSSRSKNDTERGARFTRKWLSSRKYLNILNVSVSLLSKKKKKMGNYKYDLLKSESKKYHYQKYPWMLCPHTLPNYIIYIIIVFNNSYAYLIIHTMVQMTIFFRIESKFY